MEAYFPETQNNGLCKKKGIGFFEDKRAQKSPKVPSLHRQLQLHKFRTKARPKKGRTICKEATSHICGEWDHSLIKCNWKFEYSFQLYAPQGYINWVWCHTSFIQYSF